MRRNARPAASVGSASLRQPATRQGRWDRLRGSPSRPTRRVSARRQILPFCCGRTRRTPARNGSQIGAPLPQSHPPPTVCGPVRARRKRTPPRPPLHRRHRAHRRRVSLRLPTHPAGRATDATSGGAPKEQPPRNLSGTRTDRVGQRWKEVGWTGSPTGKSAHAEKLSGTHDSGGTVHARDRPPGGFP